jgi:streptomycin 6-kinase
MNGAPTERLPVSQWSVARRWVQHAAGLFGELCASSPGKVVLHGDLHHDNVLQATREPWLAIDPHGVVGDPGYETGALLYNPWPERREAELLAVVPARIEQLAAGLTMPLERVVAWGFVKAVLSAVWTCQSGTMPDTRALNVAELLWPRLPLKPGLPPSSAAMQHSVAY